MKDLKNKIIVMGGCSGGIGGAIFKRLSVLKAVVIGLSRTENIELRSYILKNDFKYYWYSADPEKPAEWENCLNFVYRNFGMIDILVNCVGILIPGKFLNLTYSQIDKIISANFSSFTYAVKSIAPIMINQGSGQIINLGSLGGLIPMPFESLYCATKYALRGYTLSIHNELVKYGIKVNLISPGPVFTSMLAQESLAPDSIMTFLIKPVT